MTVVAALGQAALVASLRACVPVLRQRRGRRKALQLNCGCMEGLLVGLVGGQNRIYFDWELWGWRTLLQLSLSQRWAANTALAGRSVEQSHKAKKASLSALQHNR